jgi:ubiquitin-protein ligase E3 C
VGMKWKSWVSLKTPCSGLLHDVFIFVFMIDMRCRGEWSSLVWLAEVYTQAMVTMGDDEFFSSANAPSTATTTTTPRNPLTLDDLRVFSRKLLNIAFTLYSKEGLGGYVGESGLGRWSWENVRETVGKCLRGVHARE